MAVKVAELRALKAGTLKREDGKPVEWLPDDGKRGAGSLLFRAVGGIVRGYFRYAPETGKRDTLPIGQWDEQGKDGLTLVEIRAKADEWRKLYQSGVKDIRDHLDAERAAREAARRTEEAAQVEAERKARERQQFTLEVLCSAYVRLLEARGKGKSARDTASSFRVHIIQAHPEIAGLPANEVTPHQIAALVRAVRESGKERAAGALRSYLRAAYGAAVRAPFDSGLPAELIPFNIETNPVDAVPTVPVRAGERTLSREELRVYLEHLDEGIIDQALRLSLLAGGQRISQVLRATVSDWDGSSLRLLDPKGNRQTAREHRLPLASRGVEMVESLIQRAREKAEAGDVNPSLFLSRDRAGQAAVVNYTTCSKRATEISNAMGGEPFTVRDIRRTVETLLARMGISRDVRAQLLSHGLSGVQIQHYDRHAYTDEKARALEAWEGFLFESQIDKVVALKRGAA